MSDRLSELLRQRALLQGHLAWLDREIESASHPSAPTNSPLVLQPTRLPAADTSSPATPVPGRVSVTASPATPVTAAASVRAAAVSSAEAVVVPGAEAILDRYRVEPRSVQTDVRKGCFLYFAAAFVILGLGVAVLYFAISSR